MNRVLVAMFAAFHVAVAAPASMNISFTEFDLANGLHVIVNEDHTVPLVAVDVRYHVGSKNEVPGKTGFAHLFEHLMFEGSKNVPHGMFDEHLTNVGASNNAYTTADETNYHEVVPANHLELALWLESDRMMQFVIRDSALRTQKQVVKEEKRETDDNRPYGNLEEHMHALAYPEGCYHWPVIGSMADIDAATMTDVRDFFATYYVPNNATLVLAGDVTADDAKRLAEKWFNDVKKGAKELVRPAVPAMAQPSSRVESLTEDVPAPAVFATYHAPAEGSADADALDLLSMVLGSGESSRLHHELVYTKQTSSDAGSYLDAGELASLMYVYAIGVEEETNIDSLEHDIFAQVDRIAAEGISDRELQKVKNQKESSLVFAVSGALGRADALSHAHVMLGGAGELNRQIDRINRITAADVRRVAKMYCSADKRNVVRYLPKKDSK